MIYLPRYFYAQAALLGLLSNAVVHGGGGGGGGNSSPAEEGGEGKSGRLVCNKLELEVPYERSRFDAHYLYGFIGTVGTTRGTRTYLSIF